MTGHVDTKTTYPFNSAGHWARGRDAVVQAFMDAGEGEIVSYETLKEVSGRSDDAGLNGIIQSAVRLCEKKHGVVMVNRPGVGYERGTNGSRAHKAVRFGRSVFRKVRRAVAIGATVDAETLPKEERASFAARMAALGGARAFMHPTRVAAQSRKIESGQAQAGHFGKAFKGESK